MDNLRAVIVGAGRIAGGYDEGRRDGKIMSHAGAYRAHGGFEVVACVEPDEIRRQSFMDYWAIPNGFSDLKEWVESDVAADVVSLCAPSDLHDAMLRRLAKTEIRAVWAEKPLTANPATAGELARTLSDAGIAVAVGYLRRWDPAMERLRADFADGSLGRLQAAVVYYGGGLLNNGTHALDLLRDWFGPLRAVAARRGAGAQDGADPTYDVRLATQDGAIVQLVGLDAGRFAMFEMTLVTTTGRIDIDDHGFTVRRRDAGDDPAFPGQRSLGAAKQCQTGLDTAMVAIASNLHDAVTRGAAIRCDPSDAAATLTLCAEIREMADG